MTHNVISRKILEITVIYTKISYLETLYLSVDRYMFTTELLTFSGNSTAGYRWSL